MRKQEMSDEEKRVYRMWAAGRLREELQAITETETEGRVMMRFWVSWWSGYYEDEGCTKPPFQVWISGSRNRDEERDEVSLCAVVDASSEGQVWNAVKRHFPDFEMRFCDEVSNDWSPPRDRFPDYLEQTSITDNA